MAMANRPFFTAKFDDGFYLEDTIDFEFYNGFSITQKQKSIESMHREIIKKHPENKVLEVSRKSQDVIGIKLSAFNLVIYNNEFQRSIPVECAFQSSKVFENNEQYKDLLLVTPIEAKRDARLKNSGNIKLFSYDGICFPNVPRTFFYDWLYISALKQNEILLEDLAKYDTFTDIEFNPKKSLNCQARACALAVSLYKQDLLEKYLSNLELFKAIYKNRSDSFEQISLF